MPAVNATSPAIHRCANQPVNYPGAAGAPARPRFPQGAGRIASGGCRDVRNRRRLVSLRFGRSLGKSHPQQVELDHQLAYSSKQLGARPSTTGAVVQERAGEIDQAQRVAEFGFGHAGADGTKQSGVFEPRRGFHRSLVPMRPPLGQGTRAPADPTPRVLPAGSPLTALASGWCAGRAGAQRSTDRAA